MKRYQVTYKKDDTLFCTNLAVADSEEKIREAYPEVVGIRELTDDEFFYLDIEKGMPIVNLDTPGLVLQGEMIEPENFGSDISEVEALLLDLATDGTENIEMSADEMFDYVSAMNELAYDSSRGFTYQRMIWNLLMMIAEHHV